MHRLDFVFWSQTKILRKVKFDEFEIQMCNSQCKCYVSCILSRKPRSFLTKTLAQKVQQELPLCTRLVYQVPLVYPVGSPILPDCLLVFTIEHDFKRFTVLDLHLDDAVQLIVGHVNNLIILS